MYIGLGYLLEMDRWFDRWKNTCMSFVRQMWAGNYSVHFVMQISRKSLPVFHIHIKTSGRTELMVVTPIAASDIYVVYRLIRYMAALYIHTTIAVCPS